MDTTNWLNGLAVSGIHGIMTYYVNSAIFPMSNEGREHHGFIYIRQGTETFYFEDGQITAVPNSVLYLPKDSRYHMTLEGEEIVVIFIDFEISAAEGSTPFLVKFDDEAIGHLFSDAENFWNLKSGDCQAVCKSLLYRICARIIRKLGNYQNVDTYAVIKESVNYLHRHYLDKGFQVSQLSQRAKISRRYYEQLFYARFGMTPKEYVLDLKIARGKELLLCEKNLVRDVALQLGYSDIYYFGKIFKAKTGYTPGQYRKAHL